MAARRRWHERFSGRKDGFCAGPDFLMDPNTTSGKFAFTWDTFWETPFYYMVDDDAHQEGPNSPNAGIIAYADAVAMGYAPTEATQCHGASFAAVLVAVQTSPQLARRSHR